MTYALYSCDECGRAVVDEYDTLADGIGPVPCGAVYARTDEPGTRVCPGSLVYLFHAIDELGRKRVPRPRHRAAP